MESLKMTQRGPRNKHSMHSSYYCKDSGKGGYTSAKTMATVSATPPAAQGQPFAQHTVLPIHNSKFNSAWEAAAPPSYDYSVDNTVPPSADITKKIDLESLAGSNHKFSDSCTPFASYLDTSTPSLTATESHAASLFGHAEYSYQTTGSGYGCSSCAEKDDTMQDLEDDVKRYEETFEMYDEEEARQERKISRLKSRLSHTEGQLKRATRSADTFTKSRVQQLELELYHTKGAKAKTDGYVSRQELTIMDLEDVVGSQSETIKAGKEKKKARQDKKQALEEAVACGMSLEEAFEAACSIIDDDVDYEDAAELSLDGDDSEGDDSGVEVGSAAVDGMEM